MSTENSNWKNLLTMWPEQLPRRGVVVASYGEQIPFENFLIRQNLVLFERRAPDALGARKVFLGFDNILGVKIVDPVKTTVFQAAGFTMPENATAGA